MCDNIKFEKFSFEDYKTVAKVLEVYDGDTVTLGFTIPNTNLAYRWKCRLNGIDTPELRSKNTLEKERATLARNALIEKIPIGCKVNILCGKFDKYGRILVTIFVDEENINDYMIKTHYAIAYDGGKKQEFIPENFKIQILK